MRADCSKERPCGSYCCCAGDNDRLPAEAIVSNLKALRGLQDVLGEFQDTEVQSLAVVSFARDMAASGETPVETQMAMGMVAAAILERQAAARERFSVQFDRFAKPSNRKAYTELFKPEG